MLHRFPELGQGQLRAGVDFRSSGIRTALPIRELWRQGICCPAGSEDICRSSGSLEGSVSIGGSAVSGGGVLSGEGGTKDLEIRGLSDCSVGWCLWDGYCGGWNGRLRER